MAVNSNSVIKCFDILENKAISLAVVHDAESVKPFTLDISGNFEVSSNDTEATLSCEFWSSSSGWISLNALGVNTSIVNNNGVLKFISELSGDVVVEIYKNHENISGTVNMTAGEVYFINLNDMRLLDEDGNEIEIDD